MKCKTTYHGDWSVSIFDIAQDKTQMDQQCDECLERFTDSIETLDD